MENNVMHCFLSLKPLFFAEYVGIHYIKQPCLRLFWHHENEKVTGPTTY